MSNSRVPQIRMTEHLSDGVKLQPVSEGMATVPSGKQGGSEGWFLPGGIFTRNRKQAEFACKEMNAIMQRLGPIKPPKKIQRAA